MYDDSGKPVNYWREEIVAYTQEKDALRQGRLDPKLSPAEQIVMGSDIDWLETAAKMGKLNANGPEAKPIRNVIVRLAHARVPVRAFGRVPRVPRLYLGEPRDLDKTLLPLHLATKEASEEGLEEQNQAIDEAISRARAWAS